MLHLGRAESTLPCPLVRACMPAGVKAGLKWMHLSGVLSSWLWVQDTQKGDITIKMTWTSVELDADSDIKAEEGDDDVDEEMAEEIENAPVNNSGGQ